MQLAPGTTALILTSAGIAALVSGSITIIGQYFERRSRRRETLLTLASKLAEQRTELTLKAAESQRKHAKLFDNVYLVEEYYQWLEVLVDKGRLPKHAIDRKMSWDVETGATLPPRSNE